MKLSCLVFFVFASAVPIEVDKRDPFGIAGGVTNIIKAAKGGGASGAGGILNGVAQIVAAAKAKKAAQAGTNTAGGNTVINGVNPAANGATNTNQGNAVGGVNSQVIPVTTPVVQGVVIANTVQNSGSNLPNVNSNVVNPVGNQIPQINPSVNSQSVNNPAGNIIIPPQNTAQVNNPTNTQAAINQVGVAVNTVSQANNQIN
ncbi:hypothetical protein HDV04_004419 [Boothiomyces sp. JEL0838]|nr:hypothetical protein HDV04_004419 [Boothiomyces sp. JEL0838]